MTLYLRGRTKPSPFGAREHLHQLGDLAPLLVGVATGDRMLDAMADVIAQHLVLDAAQRGADRRQLSKDVDAVSVLADHARDTAHLALDPAEAFEALGFDFRLHG